jgi:hypothetical protein
MMDWTDDLSSSFSIKSLAAAENACHLYGTSNLGRSRPLSGDTRASRAVALMGIAIGALLGLR